MCECRKKMDEKLEAANGRLAVAILINGPALIGRFCIQTEKLDKAKRKPVPTVIASFCPFCGEKEQPAC